MATLAYPFEVRDSANSTTDNRKTGLTPAVSNGKTLAASPATVTASGNVTVVEVGAGIYVALYDAEANADAAFPVDWGAGLSNPNDRYGSLVLTRDAGRIVTNLDAQVSSRSTFAGGAVASVTGNIGGSLAGAAGASAPNWYAAPPTATLETLTVSASPSPTSTTFTATGTFSPTAGRYNPTAATNTTGQITRVVRWTGGANTGSESPILSYAGSGAFVLAVAANGTIANGDTGQIL